MSDDQTPETPEKEQAGKTSSGNVVKIALLAGVLGIAVGAGLYAFLPAGDNGLGDGLGDNVSAAAGSCRVDQVLKAKLDKAAVGEVAAFTSIDRAYSVSSLPFNDVDGIGKTLGDYSGKTLLVNLWATWCAPCRAEMPALEALNREMGGDSFEVLPISVDLGDPSKPKKFYKDIGLKDIPFLHDPDLATLTSLKKDGLAYGLPATILVGEDGCVLGVLNGPAEWAGTDAKQLVEAAM